MFENNKSYRLKCNKEQDEYLKLNISQDFDLLNVLSLNITQEDAYKLYASNYGVVVGRVLANDGFGIPNAKISIFTPNVSNDRTVEKNIIYPYTTTTDKNNDGIRYNLLPDNKQSNCYQNVGTMSSKMDVLDNDSELEAFDNFYKFTTTTNDSGDYMFFGIPTGNQQIHVDIDLSDIGLLSQAPRDMIYKGYNLKSFESPNKFKKSTNLDSLPQIITQDTTVFVYPFWGDESQGDIAISKKNINIQYKFEPTCVFMGSIFTDSLKSGINKNCKPSKTSGKMSELMSSQGLVEMIRKTQDGRVEQFDVNGGRVINNDGVWCYQIPMNLDYMVTDEYGNLVPTDNPSIGIPTRAEVRFRITIDDNGDSFTQSKTASYLIPNNPKTSELEDYAFDENCKNESFVNLFWNKVYSVKNYIPRLQKGTSSTNRRFLGLKSTNYHESNNPAPFNKLFIDLNLKFKVMCLISKFYIILIGMINTWVIGFLNKIILSNTKELPYLLLEREFLDDCTFLPTNYNGKDLTQADYFVIFDKKNYITKENFGTTLLGAIDKKNNGSTNYASQRKKNAVDVHSDGCAQIKGGGSCVGWGRSAYDIKVCFGTRSYSTYPYAAIYPDLKDKLIDCLETNLSSSSEVVNFDFTNDWLNGSLYAPRFFTKTRVNRKTGVRQIKFCGSKSNYNNLYLVNTCATAIDTNSTTPSLITGANNDCRRGECYEQSGSINSNFGDILYDVQTDKFIYKSNFNYLGKLFYYHPTDIILLGGLSDVDNDGIPKLHQLLPSSSFKMVDDVAEVEDSYTKQFPIIAVTGYTFSGGYTYLSEIYSTDYQGSYVDYKPKPGIATTIYHETIEDDFRNYDNGYFVWNTTSSTYNTIDPDNYITESYGTVGYHTVTVLGFKLSSGIDWSNDNSEIAGGLFTSIGCLSSITLIKSCVNAERLCEIGVDFDENYDFVDYNGTTITTKNVDGFISLDELSEGDSRGMFATLNKNNLKTINNQYGLKKYDFKYIYPTGFDGKLQPNLTYDSTVKLVDHSNYLATDYKSSEYNKFRFGNDNGGSYTYDTSYKLPRYENSFYFYFGLKQGSTALDVFNSQYYTPCKDVTLPEFNFSINNITKHYGCGEKGSASINVSKIIHPYKIYINDILYLDNIENNNPINLNNLDSGVYLIKVIDGNGETILRTLNITYGPCYSYTPELINDVFQLDYIPEYTYNNDFIDYVAEEVEI